MRGSPFIKPFEARIKVWEERLLKIQDTLDEWLKVSLKGWVWPQIVGVASDVECGLSQTLRHNIP